MTADFRAHLASVRAETADPEMRLLIDAVLREDADALEAVRTPGGFLATRLLRGLRIPQRTQRRLYLVR